MKKIGLCVVVSVLFASSSMLSAMSSDFSGHEEKNTPLITAVEQDDSAWVAQLLARDNDTEVSDVCGRTPFLIAVAHGNLDILDLLIQYGVSITAIDVLGNNALHIAVLNKQISLIPWLIKSGLDIHALNFQDQSPLRIALEKGGGEVLEALFPDINNP
ncbi:MAG: ankyrin repeat domain-containing protein [Candidatus Babeliales bacterium]|jgi:ankyrin repeat protein